MSFQMLSEIRGRGGGGGGGRGWRGGRGGRGGRGRGGRGNGGGTIDTVSTFDSVETSSAATTPEPLTVDNSPSVRPSSLQRAILKDKGMIVPEEEKNPEKEEPDIEEGIQAASNDQESKAHGDDDGVDASTPDGEGDEGAPEEEGEEAGEGEEEEDGEGEKGKEKEGQIPAAGNDSNNATKKEVDVTDGELEQKSEPSESKEGKDNDGGTDEEEAVCQLCYGLYGRGDEHDDELCKQDEKEIEKEVDEEEKKEQERRNKSKALRHGILDFGGGSKGKFIFVPDNYVFETEKGFHDLLAALGIKLPDLAFVIPNGYGIVPNKDKEETDWQKYQDAKTEKNCPVNESLRDKSLKFAQEGRDHYQIALTMDRVRNIMESIADVCAQTSNAMYLLTDPSSRNEAAVLACEAAASRDVPCVGLFDCSCLVEEEEIFTNNDEYVVGLGDDPRKEIKVEKDKNCYYWENEDPDDGLGTCDFSELAQKCSHRLVFEMADDWDRFEKVFMKMFPVGIFACGSSEYEFEYVKNALRTNQPIFVLENTGAVSNAAARLLALGELIHYGQLKTRDEMKKFIKSNFPPEKFRKQLAYDDYLWTRAKIVAETFQSLAPGFNPDRSEILDVNGYVNSTDVQDRVTRFLATFGEDIPEFGGRGKDHASIDAALKLEEVLAAARRRYNLQATLFQILIRTTLFFTTVLTVVHSQFNKNLNYGELLKAVNIILPITGSILISLDAGLRPGIKYACLLLAEKKIQSESYRFLTRTGVYNYRHIVGDREHNVKRTRERFADACEKIFADCMDSEVSTGTIFSVASARAEADQLAHRTQGTSNSRQETSNHPPAKMKFKVAHDWMYAEGNIRRKPYDGSKEAPDLEKGEKAPEETERRKNMTRISTRRDVLDYSMPNTSTAPTTPTTTPTNETGRLAHRHHLHIDTQEYIDLRVKRELTHTYADVPENTRYRFWLQVCIVTLTSISAAFVALGLEVWVPVLVAGAATFEFAYSYQDLDSLIPSLNTTAGELTSVLIWWTGLTQIQTRLQTNKNLLVERTERAILARYEQMAGNTIASAKKRYEEAKKEHEGANAGPAPKGFDEKKAQEALRN